MSKIGVNLSINVKDIDKARLVNHTNGKTYLNMTVFIDPNNPGQYGDHGMITQDVSKQEKRRWGASTTTATGTTTAATAASR